MAPSFTCPNCGKLRSLADSSLIGRKIRCSCGQTFRLTEQLLQLGQAENQNAGLPTSQPVPYQPQPVSDPLAMPPASQYSPPPATTHPNPPGYPSDPLHTHRAPVRMAGRHQYSRGSVLQMLLSMAAATMLIVFSVIVFFGTSYSLSQASDIKQQKIRMDEWNGRFGNARVQVPTEWEARETSTYRMWIIIGIASAIVGLLAIGTGVCQLVVSYRRFLSQANGFSWADSLNSGVSLVCLLATVVACVYGLIQVGQVFGFQNRAASSAISSLESMGQGDRARELREQVAEQNRALSSVKWEVRWTIIKQGLIHAIFPALALGMSCYLIFFRS